MREIADDAVFIAEEGHELSQVPDGYVIYQAARDRVHFLNPTAVIVYELCAAGCSVQTIDAFLQDAFQLTEPPVVMVRDCLGSLLDEELLRICPPSSSVP